MSDRLQSWMYEDPHPVITKAVGSSTVIEYLLNASARTQGAAHESRVSAPGNARYAAPRNADARQDASLRPAPPPACSRVRSRASA